MLPDQDLVPSAVRSPSPSPSPRPTPLCVSLSRSENDDSKHTESDEPRPESALPVARKRDRHTREDALPLERPAKRPHRPPDLEAPGKLQYRQNLVLGALSVVLQHWRLSWCSLCVSPSVLSCSLSSFHSFSTSSPSSIACPSSCVSLWTSPSLSTALSTTISSAIPCSISLSQSPRSTVAVVHRLASPKDFFFSRAAESLLDIAPQSTQCVGDNHTFDYNSYNNNNNINTHNNNENNNDNTGTVEESRLSRLFRALSSTHGSLFSSMHSPLPAQSFAVAAEEVGESYESCDGEIGHCGELFAEDEEDEEEEDSPRYHRQLLCQYLQELLFHLIDIENGDLSMESNTETMPQRSQFMLEFAMRSFLFFAHQRLLDRYVEEISTLEETEFRKSQESNTQCESDPIWMALSQINGDLEHLEKCALSLFLVGDLVCKRCLSTSCEAMSVLEQASLIVFLLKLLEEFSVHDGGCVKALSESLSSLATQFSYSSLFLSSMGE